MQRILVKGLNLLYRVCVLISQILFAIMVIVILILVICRYSLGFSFPWSEELARYCMIWMVMLAAAAVLYRDGHIRMDFLRANMSPRTKLITGLFSRLCIIVYLVVLIWQGFLTAKFMAVTQSPSIGFSMFIPYLALPVAGIIMLLFEMARAAGDVALLIKPES